MRIPFSDFEGVRYRDLNANGRMDPFEDPRLSAEERCADLLGRLTAREKAALLLHPIMGIGHPTDLDSPARPSPLSPRQLIAEQGFTHFNLHSLPSPEEMAAWHNAMQEVAETTSHGIPITFSSDPRHSFTENSGVAFAAGDMSLWPEPIGLAAVGDTDLVREFGDVVRREYAAVGLRSALHPQVDLATEPRWGRQAQTFGPDAAKASEMVVAFLEAMQGGAGLGRTAVACTTKHFPGGGPQLDGEDPHFPYGREQVYPAGAFEDHLAPFRAAVSAGTSAIMPYYGMPIGLELDGSPIEAVGFAFNRRIITDLLRDELGFDGVVLTDFGLITDRAVFGKPFPARAWGVEHLAPLQRAERLLNAGVDQFGGEDRLDLIMELLETGRVDEARITQSASRVLLVKFRLGLFDDPYVDTHEATRVVGTAESRARGEVTQARAVTVLKNDPTNDGSPLLPLRLGSAYHLVGVEADAVRPYGTVVDKASDADVVLIRLKAPFEPRDTYFLESSFHQGSLEFPEAVVDKVRALADDAPVVLDVFLERPAILGPVEDLVHALVGSYGASDKALLAALTGGVHPDGRLPFDIPASMAAVRAGAPDKADSAGAQHRAGTGLEI